MTAITTSALTLVLFGCGVAFGYAWGRNAEADAQRKERRRKQNAETTVFSDPHAIQAFADLRYGLQDLRSIVELHARHTLGALDRLEAAEERRAETTPTP